MSVSTSTQLLIACWATVIVLSAMALVFWRSKKNAYAIAVLPLMLPPCMHLLSGILARGLDLTLPFTTSFHIRIVIDLIAAVAACVLIGLASQIIAETRKGRTAFVLSCSAFIIVFSSILIMNSLSQYITALGLL